MAEEAATTDAQQGDAGKQDDGQKAGQGNGTGTQQDAGKTFTQAELDDIVKDRLKRERQKFEGFDDLKAKADQFDQLQESQKSDLEKLTGDRDSLKGENSSLKLENTRLKVALEKGLTGERAEIASLLQGKNAEEMGEHADRLLKLMASDAKQEQTKTLDGGTRTDAADDQTDQALDRFWNERAGIYQPSN